jgi:hypothetical protein
VINKNDHDPITLSASCHHDVRSVVFFCAIRPIILYLLLLIYVPLAAAQTSADALSQGVYLAAGPSSVQGVSIGGIPSGPTGGSSSFAGAATGPSKGSNLAIMDPFWLLDVKHFTTDFYDEFGNRLKRDASVRTSLRAGIKLFTGKVEMSGGVGAAKLTAEPRIYHNRSDGLLQVYPTRSQWFDFMIYVNGMFPVRVEDLDPTEYNEGGLYDDDLRRAIDATIVVAGFSPKVKGELLLSGGRLSAFFLADARVMFFSKALTGEDSTNAVGLDENSTYWATSADKPLVDRAPRYAHQQMLAVGYSPGFFPSLQFEVSGSFESRYIPDYFYNRCSRTWNYTYNGDRVSYTKFKLNLDLTANTNISSESYYIRNGFFAEDRINNQSRFKNIFSFTTRF